VELARRSVVHVPLGDTQPAALVPAHLWRAAAAMPEADFLTQQYLAPRANEDPS
jgi:hypothetical protein